MMCQSDHREGGTSIFMSMECQRDQREGGTSKPMSMECQREGGTSKPWVHGVTEGPERGWDQQTLGP